jgi:hypothetical protein
MVGLASCLRDRLYQGRSGGRRAWRRQSGRTNEYAAKAPMTLPRFARPRSGSPCRLRPTSPSPAAVIVLTAPNLEGIVLSPASTCPHRRHQQKCAVTGFLQRLPDPTETLGVGSFRSCHPGSTHAYDVSSDRDGRQFCDTWAARKRTRGGSGATSRQRISCVGQVLARSKTR